MAQVKKTVSLKTGTGSILKMDKQKEQLKNGGLEIVQKVLTELKITSTNKKLLTILEKLFNADKCSKDINCQKMNIIIMFLRMLEMSPYNDYGDVFHEFDRYFMSKELRKVTVKNMDIKEYLVLGEGDFGTVLLGQLGVSLVAVKIKHAGIGGTLLPEAKIMAGLDHKNVVKLVGLQKNPMKLVMEHVQGGRLRAAVHNHLISGKGILKAIHDVATGMEYIAGKNIVHRDLDGNNIFVDSNKVCKIGDFGLAKYVGHSPNLEYKDQKGLHILCITAPESVATHIFTTKSDVWSFGILILDLYEIVDNMSLDMQRKKMMEVIANLARGILSFPIFKQCPEHLFKYVFDQLINLDASQRPEFPSIREKIAGLL